MIYYLKGNSYEYNFKNLNDIDLNKFVDEYMELYKNRFKNITIASLYPFDWCIVKYFTDIEIDDEYEFKEIIKSINYDSMDRDLKDIECALKTLTEEKSNLYYQSLIGFNRLVDIIIGYIENPEIKELLWEVLTNSDYSGETYEE